MSGPARACLGALLVLAASGCRTARGDAAASGERGFLGAGLASYYGPGLQGRLTASGERFDKEQLTAAHRTAAFGECLRVVNARNGRSVRVRVNDRGPFVAGRIIDVSEAAARALDLLASGVAPVRVYRCLEPR